MGFKALLLIVAVFGVAGCESGASTKTSVPSPSPPPNSAAIRQEAAINAFLLKNYPGWEMQGTAPSVSTDCDVTDPCSVHITKNNETKILVLIVKEFIRPDGTTYWLAFEAKPVDLAKVKLDKIKEITREQERQETLDASERADAEYMDRDYDPRR